MTSHVSYMFDVMSVEYTPEAWRHWAGTGSWGLVRGRGLSKLEDQCFEANCNKINHHNVNLTIHFYDLLFRSFKINHIKSITINYLLCDCNRRTVDWLLLLMLLLLLWRSTPLNSHKAERLRCGSHRRCMLLMKLWRQTVVAGSGKGRRNIGQGHSCWWRHGLEAW